MAAQPAPRRILIVRLSSLGDVIQTLPLPSAIRRSFPQAKIGWVIDAALGGAIQGHPAIDYIHACPRHLWRRMRWTRAARELHEFCRIIAQCGYDASIDAQGLLISALIPYLAGIKRRVGFNHRRELSHLFYTERRVSKREYFDHDAAHSAHMLQLARALGCDTGCARAVLPIAAQVRARMAERLVRAFTRAAPLIALTPGTQWTSKSWPPEYWRALLEMIMRRTAANVVIAGSPDDAGLAAQIAAGTAADRLLNLAGRTTLPELYALMELAAVVIGPDSAPLHVAGAGGRAHLVGIYGPTPPRRTGPSGSPWMRLLSTGPPLHCQPCRRARCRYGTNQCMNQVTPAQVFAAVAEAINAAGFNEARWPGSD